MDHVALWMPMLILAISHDLHELFGYWPGTPKTQLCEFEAKVVMTVYSIFVFVVRILCTKYDSTDLAAEMVYVVLLPERGYVRAPQSFRALVAEEIQSTEVVSFAEDCLSKLMLRIFIDGIEF
jgi:hypothetical protein